jgi:hypothetical protein
MKDIESCPEKMGHFVMKNGGHRGHSGNMIARLLAKRLELEEDPLVSILEFSFILHFQSPREGRGCGLLSAKGGLMMGTKKVGALSSPQKRANSIIAKKKIL